MLNIEEILKMSEDMGVEIVDGTSGKHYILDDSGKEVEFNTDVIFGKRRETISYEVEVEVELEGLSSNLDNSKKIYNMSSSVNSYEYKPVIVKDSIIDAA